MGLYATHNVFGSVLFLHFGLTAYNKREIENYPKCRHRLPCITKTSLNNDILI